MNKDKEAMLAMLADKYEEIIHNSEIKQARDEGMDIGEKKGIAIGEKKGIAIGEKKGIAIGEKKGIAIGEKKGIAIGEKNALTRTLALINVMIQNGQGDDIPRLQTDPVFLDEMFSKYSIK